jgi:hypothetical protein
MILIYSIIALFIIFVILCILYLNSNKRANQRVEHWSDSLQGHLTNVFHDTIRNGYKSEDNMKYELQESDVQQTKKL